MRKDTRSMEFRTDDDEVCRQASESMESNRAWIVTEVQVSYGLTPQLHRVRLSEIYVAGELSDAEYASYKDALDNYEAWVRRINNEAQTLRSKRIVPK